MTCGIAGGGSRGSGVAHRLWMGLGVPACRRAGVPACPGVSPRGGPRVHFLPVGGRADGVQGRRRARRTKAAALSHRRPRLAEAGFHVLRVAFGGWESAGPGSTAGLPALGGRARPGRRSWPPGRWPRRRPGTGRRPGQGVAVAACPGVQQDQPARAGPASTGASALAASGFAISWSPRRRGRRAPHQGRRRPAPPEQEEVPAVSSAAGAARLHGATSGTGVNGCGRADRTVPFSGSRPTSAPPAQGVRKVKRAFVNRSHRVVR
jgi:hypothetical protein